MTTEPSRQRYWPGHWLVPQIDVLRAQLMPLTEDAADFEKHQRLELQLEQLPYCLGATSYALCELITTQNLTVTLDFASPGPRADFHVLRPYERDRMGFLIDSTIEAARRAQNALVLYIDKACKKSLPNSLAELANSRTHLRRLPKNVADSVTNYWEAHGKRLRDYRVLSQHHAVVSSDARTFISAEGIPCIYLVLPNNPEVKNVSLLRYEAPFVHAVPYLQRQFVELVRFCFIVCELLIDPSKPRRVLLGEPLKSAISMGQPLEGHRLLTLDDTAKLLHHGLPHLKAPVGL